MWACVQPTVYLSSLYFVQLVALPELTSSVCFSSWRTVYIYNIYKPGLLASWSEFKLILRKEEHLLNLKHHFQSNFFQSFLLSIHTESMLSNFACYYWWIFCCYAQTVWNQKTWTITEWVSRGFYKDQQDKAEPEELYTNDHQIAFVPTWCFTGLSNLNWDSKKLLK